MAENLPANWRLIKLTDSFINKTSSKKIQQKDYLMAGALPVIDQSKDFIGGYTDNLNLKFSGDLPIILFGDHTRCVKYIDFPFAQGADGVKILSPKNFYLPKAFFYALQNLKNLEIPNLGYRRHFPLFKNLTIPVPPLDEQKRIVALLDNLFEKLDAAKSILQKISDGYELRRAAILHRAFTGKLTENFRAGNGLTLEDWQEKNLSDLLLPMETRRPTGETFRYIDIDSIDNKRQAVKSPKIIETAKAPSRASRAVDSGNILFSMVRPYLKNIALIDDNLKDCIASTGFFVCRCNEEILPKFLYWFLCFDGTINYLTQFMRGDNSPSIRKDDFLNAPISLPPLAEQKEIARLLDNFITKENRVKEIAEKTLQQIDALKKNILARAFRGELGTNIR